MGERRGAGLVECLILDALDSLGAHPGRRYRPNAQVLAAVEDRIGLAPGYAYEVLLDLSRAVDDASQPDQPVRQPRWRARVGN